MSTITRLTLSSLILCLALATAARAAEQPPAGTLSKEATAAGPAVDTSANANAAETSATDTSKTNVSPPPRTDAAPPAAPSSTSQRTAGPRAAVRNDRLDLDTTVVTGNRELPKVLYIVPWKKSDLGDLPAQPFNTLLDEALTPVDRDVFRREVTYYDAINSEGRGAAAGAAAQPPRSEK